MRESEAQLGQAALKSYLNRESIWTIPTEARFGYFTAFTALMVMGFVGEGGLDWRLDPPLDGPLFFDHMASVTIASAGLALMAIEIGGIGMVMASILLEAWDRFLARKRREDIDKEFGQGTYEMLVERRERGTAAASRTHAPRRTRRRSEKEDPGSKN